MYLLEVPFGLISVFILIILNGIKTGYTANLNPDIVTNDNTNSLYVAAPIHHREHSRNLLVDYSGWETASSTPSRFMYKSAIGYFGNSVFIFGELTNRQQLYEFGITTEGFTDLGQTNLSDPIFGGGQFYTQVGDEIIVIANLINDG
eukprot:9417_1